MKPIDVAITSMVPLAFAAGMASQTFLTGARPSHSASFGVYGRGYVEVDPKLSYQTKVVPDVAECYVGTDGNLHLMPASMVVPL